MDQVTSHTMIALHLRDSTMHLITSSQHVGSGIRHASADHPFAALIPYYRTVTLNLRDLYRVRCYSIDALIIMA